MVQIIVFTYGSRKIYDHACVNKLNIFVFKKRLWPKYVLNILPKRFQICIQSKP